MRRVVGLLLASIAAAGTARAADEPGRPRPRVLAHVMTWFEAKDAAGRGAWGWHWTMGRVDPDARDAAGDRPIAAHLHPMIGPYDSLDPAVVEYQVALMKVAGIDGAIADWYGTGAVNDYPGIHARTRALFDALSRRKMAFAACYEDRALKAEAEKASLRPDQVVDRARADLRFCEENWFPSPSYARVDGRPLLMVFGPDYLTRDQWTSAFAGLSRPVAFFTLHERKEPAIGSFAWPPMWMSKAGKLGSADLDSYYGRFEGRPGPKIAVATPRFRDYYAEAGVHASYGTLDDAGGETLRRTLDRALRSGAPIVQVATWNDYGEGTCVEPTRELGYRDLEIIQGAIRAASGAGFPFRAEDLRLPRRIYDLRRGGRAPAGAIDEAAGLLFGGRAAEAARRLAEVEGTGR